MRPHEMFNDYCIGLVHRLFHSWHLFNRKTIAFMRRINESFGLIMKKSSLYEFYDVTSSFIVAIRVYTLKQIAVCLQKY